MVSRLPGRLLLSNICFDCLGQEKENMRSYDSFICEACEGEYMTSPSWGDECYCRICYMANFGYDPEPLDNDTCACGHPDELGVHWSKEDGNCCPAGCECDDC